MKKLRLLALLLIMFPAAKAQNYVFVKCISGDCQNGTGVAEFEDQFFKNAGQVIYKGTFKSGKMSGEGILSTNVVYYAGSFEDNEYRGYGIEFYSKKVDGINVPDSSKTVSFGKWDTDGGMQAIQVWEEGRKSFYNTEGRSGHKKNFRPYKSFNDKWIEQHADAHIASRSEIFAAETARKAAATKLMEDRQPKYEVNVITEKTLHAQTPPTSTAAATAKPDNFATTNPVNSSRPSEHLTVNGNTITVKNWGAKFDGEYDILKLAADSCVSGNCEDGHGRKILVSITGTVTSIRIMEGKFKHTVFLGEGVMLIDGEGDVLDGTYELGKFKVNYTHNTLQSKTTFHSKFTNEAVEGNFSGYLDDGIGKALPEYRKFVVCKFAPEYHDKPATVTAWERDIYQPAYIKWHNALINSPEFKAGQAEAAAERERKYGPQNNSSKNSTPASGNNNQTKLTIKSTCSACHGSGRIGHNETQTQFNIDGKDIKTIRMVYETCSSCNGSGYN